MDVLSFSVCLSKHQMYKRNEHSVCKNGIYFEVVDRGSETQLQVGEQYLYLQLNSIISRVSVYSSEDITSDPNSTKFLFTRVTFSWFFSKFDKYGSYHLVYDAEYSMTIDSSKYFKYFFVRHPLDRVASAYISKLVVENEPNRKHRRQILVRNVNVFNCLYN